MKIVDKGLNNYAIAIEEAEGQIRITVLKYYLSGVSLVEIKKQVNNIIISAVKDIKIVSLRQDTQAGLLAFSVRQLRTLKSMLGNNGLIIAAIIGLNDTKPFARQNTHAERYLAERIGADAKGVPLQQYYSDVYKQKILPAIKRLADMNALDPSDTIGKNSLRNLAEMEVRYNEHLEEIESFKKSGVRLVVCSVHADCSDRCYKWQGRVYSTDGSYGVTNDGKKYVPLSKATDVYYTTKAGRVYKNGLLGFNCRHKLYEYKPGMIIPYVSKEMQKKENAINTKQRLLESEVRRYKTYALEYKDVSREMYLKYRKKAIIANKKYIEFSHASNRAYYPDRTKII